MLSANGRLWRIMSETVAKLLIFLYVMYIYTHVRYTWKDGWYVEDTVFRCVVSIKVVYLEIICQLLC